MHRSSMLWISSTGLAPPSVCHYRPPPPRVGVRQFQPWYGQRHPHAQSAKARHPNSHSDNEPVAHTYTVTNHNGYAASDADTDCHCLGHANRHIVAHTAAHGHSEASAGLSSTVAQGAALRSQAAAG